jgi:hypothetical protein
MSEKPLCSIEGCTKLSANKGLCNPHYQSQYRRQRSGSIRTTQSLQSVLTILRKRHTFLMARRKELCETLTTIDAELASIDQVLQMAQKEA